MTSSLLQLCRELKKQCARRLSHLRSDEQGIAIVEDMYCRYSGRALSGRGQICRDREQALLNPVASHVVVESVKQLYRCLHMVETPFVGSCVETLLSIFASIDFTSEKLVLLRLDVWRDSQGDDRERRYGCHMYVLIAMDSSI